MTRNEIAASGALLSMCEQQGLRLVVNLDPGLGHLASGADNFLRMRQLSEIDPARPYMVVTLSDQVKEFLDLYGDLVQFALHSKAAFLAMRDVAIFRPDLTIDVGMAHTKLIPPGNIPYRTSGTTLLVPEIGWRDTVGDIRAWYDRRMRSKSFAPWSRTLPMSAELAELIAPHGDKFALIHCKTAAGNAAPAVPDPASYHETLGWLRDLGFRLVLVGREAMPASFRDYGVIDYAGSALASTANDFRLFRAAGFALICASGLSNVADIFELPYVQVNSWWTPVIPQPSARCVEVPAMLLNTDGAVASWRQAADLFTDRDAFASWDFPEGHQARLAESGEILSASMEAMGLARSYQPRTALQIAAHARDPLDVKGRTESRIAQVFLARHSARLGLD